MCLCGKSGFFTFVVSLCSCPPFGLQATRPDGEFSGLAATLLGDAVDHQSSSKHRLHSSTPVGQSPLGQTPLTQTATPGNSALPPRHSNANSLVYSLPTVPEGMLDDMLDRASSVKSAPSPNDSLELGKKPAQQQQPLVQQRKNPLAAELALLEEDEEERPGSDDILGGKVTSNRPAVGSSESYHDVESRSQVRTGPRLTGRYLAGSLGRGIARSMILMCLTGLLNVVL